MDGLLVPGRRSVGDRVRDGYWQNRDLAREAVFCEIEAGPCA